MINVLLMRYDFDEEWAKNVLRNYLRPEMRVTILTMTHGPEIPDGDTWLKLYGSGGEIRGIFTRAYGAYGIREEQISYVSWFHDDHDSAVEKLRQADVIFMTGGLPDVFYDRLKEMRLFEEVQNFPGIVMGCSAGAMIQMTEYHITPDDDYDTYGYFQGLGMLDGFEPEVHYCGSDIQNECLHRYLSERGKTIYAITNDGGMLIENGEIRIFGDVRIFERDSCD